MAELYDFPVVAASDTVDGQGGFFSRLQDAATKGITDAAISGALSIYNTALDYAGEEAVSTEKTIREVDDEYGDYYAENKEIIDLSGFVATSLVPGTLGIKGLKLAQSGNALGAIGRTLNFAASRKNYYFEQAMTELAASGGTVTASVRSAKYAQLSWALADQTLTNAAFELGVVATMNDSPIFEGSDFGDFAINVGVGALFGGAIGGLVEHAGTRGILKEAQRKIEGNRRLFDTVFDPVKMGLTKSDEVLNFTENIVNLPDDFFNTNFTYLKDGKPVTRVLDTTGAFKDIRARAEKVAFDTLALKFNELAEGGEVTGQAMYKFILDKVKAGRDAGQDAELINDTIRGYLQGVKRVSNLTEESATSTTPKQFFINETPTGMRDLFSEVRGANTGKQAYYLKTDDPTKIKFGSVARLGYTNADEAFAEGYDAVFTTSGKIAINPKSQVISKTPDNALRNQFFLDLESGSLTTEVKLIGADLIKKADDFKPFKNTVYIGKKEFKQADAVAASLEKSSLEASARFMWASKLEDSAFKNRTILWNDFPLLDRAKLLTGKLTNSDKVSVQLADGRKISLAEIVDLPRFVNEQKLQWLQEELGKRVKGYDLRDISTAVNASTNWVEKAIAQNFAFSKDLLSEVRDLATYFKPRTVAVEWDTNLKQAVVQQGPVGPNHMSTVVLGHHYNLVTHQNIQENAARAILGEDIKRFVDAPADLAKQTSEQGAGATTLAASNADYGKRAELFVQDIGKHTALVSQKWRDAAITSMASEINAIRDSVDAAAELGILTTALRRDARKYYLVADDLTGEGMLVDRDAVKLVESGKTDDYETAVEMLRSVAGPNEKIRGIYKITNKQVTDFLDSSTRINADRVGKQTTVVNAMGLGRGMDARVVYAPPVDTRRYPHFAFVVAKEKLGANTDVAMITAKNPEQLRKLASQVGEDHEVIFKEDTKKFFKAQGQYDYNLQLNESTVNSSLQRRGILGDFFPETRAENVLEDYVRWHANSSDTLLRQTVQLKYRQFFNELAFLSEQFQSASQSAFKGVGILKKNVADPFDDYRKTALNISKQSEFPIMESMNEFVDKVGTTLYSKLDELGAAFRGSKGKDLASLETANKLMDEYGLGTPYKTMETYLDANEKVPKNLIKTSLQKVNYWLATTVLRFDFANSLVNVISTPIMLGTELASIQTLAKRDPELLGKLGELMSVKVPGQQAVVPSTTKLIGQAIKNYFGPDKLDLIKRYTDNGDIKHVSQLYHEVLDDLAYKPGLKVAEWQKKLDAAVEKGASITGNNFSEELTRFISADVMRQLSDPLVAAKKLSVQEQNAFISSFVNRVQGNYISSQRPILFQGTTGAAIGLFQTYAFNVLQQLFRHVEARDTRAMLTFAGLQTSIYGMNGLPFFDAINQHLIGQASGNTGHTDAYSILPAANKEIGDWLLYGTASAFPLFGEKAPALYSRGDINPRHLSIVPVNPLDIPAVSASVKLVNSVAQFGKQVSQGADISTAMLQALEHHGWNRPLAGFAQSLAGQSTTGNGSLISAANDLETTTMLARIQDRVVNFGAVQRILGAKPMDEAVALNNLYRNKTYEASDRAKIEALGQTIKTKLGNNQQLDPEELEDFMLDYARAGGRIETFSSSLQRWSKDANTSIVNQIANRVGSPYGKKLQMIMGGEELRDYSTIAQEPVESNTETE